MVDVFSNVDSQEKRKEAGPIFELEINDTTDTDRSASYLDLHLKIVSEEQNITTKQMISIFPL
jgi:hypothetical protein